MILINRSILTFLHSNTTFSQIMHLCFIQPMLAQFTKSLLCIVSLSCWFQLAVLDLIITKTCQSFYTEIFKVEKNENFQWQMSAIFLIFAQNIDCGYTLELPHRRYTAAYPSFAI